MARWNYKALANAILEDPLEIPFRRTFVWVWKQCVVEQGNDGKEISAEQAHLRECFLQRCLKVTDEQMITLLVTRPELFTGKMVNSEWGTRFAMALVSALREAKYDIYFHKGMITLEQHSLLKIVWERHISSPQEYKWPDSIKRDVLTAFLMYNLLRVIQGKNFFQLEFDILCKLMLMKEEQSPGLADIQVTPANAMFVNKWKWFRSGLAIALGLDRVHRSWCEPFGQKRDVDAWGQSENFQAVCNGFEVGRRRTNGAHGLKDFFVKSAWFFGQVVDVYIHQHGGIGYSGVPPEFWLSFAHACQSADPPRACAQNKDARETLLHRMYDKYPAACLPFDWFPNESPNNVLQQCLNYVRQPELLGDDDNAFGALSWNMASRYIHACVHDGLVLGKWPHEHKLLSTDRAPAHASLIYHWNNIGPHLRALTSTMKQHSYPLYLDLYLERSIDNCLGYCDIYFVLHALPKYHRRASFHKGNPPELSCRCDDDYSAKRLAVRRALPPRWIPYERPKSAPAFTVNQFSRFPFPFDRAAADEHHAAVQDAYAKVQTSLIALLGNDVRDMVLHFII